MGPSCKHLDSDLKSTLARIRRLDLDLAQTCLHCKGQYNFICGLLNWEIFLECPSRFADIIPEAPLCLAPLKCCDLAVENSQGTECWLCQDTRRVKSRMEGSAMVLQDAGEGVLWQFNRAHSPEMEGSLCPCTSHWHGSTRQSQCLSYEKLSRT